MSTRFTRQAIRKFLIACGGLIHGVFTWRFFVAELALSVFICVYMMGLSETEMLINGNYNFRSGDPLFDLSVRQVAIFNSLPIEARGFVIVSIWVLWATTLITGFAVCTRGARRLIVRALATLRTGRAPSQ